MPDIFDKKYVLKQLADMINSEAYRIIASGLATEEEVGRLSKGVVSSITNGNIKSEADVLNPLSTLHNNYVNVKLPGDFQKLACEMQDVLLLVVDAPVEAVEPKKEVVLDVEEPKKEKKSDKKEDKKFEIFELAAKNIVAKLNKIAYDLGRNGNHAAAYMVERCVGDILATASDPNRSQRNKLINALKDDDNVGAFDALVGLSGSDLGLTHKEFNDLAKDINEAYEDPDVSLDFAREMLGVGKNEKQTTETHNPITGLPWTRGPAGGKNSGRSFTPEEMRVIKMCAYPAVDASRWGADLSSYDIDTLDSIQYFINMNVPDRYVKEAEVILNKIGAEMSSRDPDYVISI